MEAKQKTGWDNFTKFVFLVLSHTAHTGTLHNHTVNIARIAQWRRRRSTDGGNRGVVKATAQTEHCNTCWTDQKCARNFNGGASQWQHIALVMVVEKKQELRWRRQLPELKINLSPASRRWHSARFSNPTLPNDLRSAGHTCRLAMQEMCNTYSKWHLAEQTSADPGNVSVHYFQFLF